MPLDKDRLKSNYKNRIYSGLKREFSAAVAKGKGFPPVADEFWMKIANAISDIAFDIVSEIKDNAEVIPGQQVMTEVAGTPPHAHPGKTVSPGKID